MVSLDIRAAPYLSGDELLDHWVFASKTSIDSV
jgi:formimidoylglutamate deiminase